MASEAIDAYECDESDRALARRHLRHFPEYVFPSYIVNPFGTFLANVCQEFIEACIAGESPRYMVFAPPQHGKSLSVSQLMPAWALGNYPHLRPVGASYGYTLAHYMSRQVMKIMDSESYAELFPGVRIAAKGRGEGKRTGEEWELAGHSGGYRARGVGEGLSGFAADPLIVDDPFKDLRDARSAVVRRDVWDWYTAVGLLRVQPGSGIMLMHTRWHVDDLAGRLLDKMSRGGTQWRVVNYPAIAEHDEEFRKVDEALCPHRFDLDALEGIRAGTTDYVWSALYQQNPTVKGGDVFRAEWWQYYEALPPLVYRMIFADTAQKMKETSDYSVFQCWGMGTDGRIYLLDQIRGKWEAPELLDQATAFWDKWRPMGPNREHTRKIMIEDKVSGTGLIQQLASRKHDPSGNKGAIPVEGIQRNVDKVIRADDGAPQIKAGNVVLPERAAWLSDYKLEFSQFMRAMSHAHDDQIDPTLDAIAQMLTSRVNIYAGAIR